MGCTCLDSRVCGRDVFGFLGAQGGGPGKPLGYRSSMLQVLRGLKSLKFREVFIFGILCLVVLRTYWIDGG